MLKIYCDSGGFRKELGALEREGTIRLFHFAYENTNKRIQHMAAPSCPTWSELKYPWSKYDRPWADYGKTSDKRHAIEDLLGRNNIRDVKHLDSAYMEGCKAFLTSDRGDIVSRRKELRLLLGIEVFHFHEDWNEFVAFVSKGG